MLDIKRLLAGLAGDDPVVAEKRRQLDHIIQECLGLTVQTTIPQAEVVPGETFNMHMTAAVSSDIVPVRWMAARYPAINTQFAVGADLQPTWRSAATRPKYSRLIRR